MGLPILILGESGTGKSASLRNFKPEEVAVINVGGKPLPFRSRLKMINTDDYTVIAKALSAMKTKVAVIDDAQYLMANEFMRRAKETGYQKFTDIGTNYWNLIQHVIRNLPRDVTVYFLSHIERDINGNEKCKTIGRMLDEKITMEGLFTIVLKTHVEDGKYTFRTQNSGFDTVKSPIGLFDNVEIDNDLAAVDAKIREYYDMNSKEKEQ